MSTRHEEHTDEEQDSLFGSPPPSPRLSTGRPASPALALPSALAGSSTSGGRSSISAPHATTQNVGTIALPGSQPDSELPINPLALSLNLGIVHRPPAQLSPAAVTPTASSSSVARTSATISQGNIALPRNVAGLSTAARKSLSRSGTPIARPATKNTKKRSRPSSRATSNEPPPEPREPEFILPDPSAPPPSHFLRNQENLLGKAGVVAGVKPSTLTHVRGSTPSNPIVVEEEDDTPKLGRRSGGGFARPYVDPSLLTAPTNQEIVQVLIGQKDIFPILEGVLKLVVGNAAATIGPRPTAFQSRGTSRQSTPAETSAPTGSEKPPPKKRKLQHVPAGAADWDVPYPFKEGEGPEAYEKTWERERGKQLISQLIQQIKVAARKAATKKYLQQQQEKQLEEELEKRRRAGQLSGPANQLSKYYRPATATYGLSEEEKNKQVYDVLKDASNASWVANSGTPSQSQAVFSPSPTLEQNAATSIPSSTPPNGNTECQQSMTPTSTFQQLADSYIASVEGNVLPGNQANASTSAFDLQGVPPLNPNTASTPQSLASASASTPSSLPTTLDQSSFDSWMNLFLQSMPPSSFDFSQLGDLSDASSMATSAMPSQCTTPAHPSADGFDTFDFGDMLGTSSASTDMSAVLATSTSNVGVHTEGSDTTSVLNGVFHQPQPMPAASSDASDMDFNFDFGNLDFASLDATSMLDPNLNVDLTMPAMQEAASPNPSMSSFTGSSVTDPATPASAAWDISLPDIGGSNSHHSDAGGSGGDQGGQGMWLDGLWDFTGSNAYAGFTPLVGWDAGLSMSMHKPIEDFGILPEPHHETPKENGHLSGAGAIERDDAEGYHNFSHRKVDKGKGRAVDSMPLLPASNGVSFSTTTPKEAAFRALVGAPLDPAILPSAKLAPTPTSTRTSTPAFSLPFTASPTQAPVATTISVGPNSSTTSTPAPAPSTARDLRRQRRMDIIKRAREKRQRLQDELDEVKKQLWATTVEQAGLLLMLRKVEEGEVMHSVDVSLS